MSEPDPKVWRLQSAADSSRESPSVESGDPQRQSRVHDKLSVQAPSSASDNGGGRVWRKGNDGLYYRKDFRVQPGEAACKGCGLPIPKGELYCNLCWDGEEGQAIDTQAEADGRLPHLED